MNKPKVGILGNCGYASIQSQTDGVMLNNPELVKNFDILIFSGGEDISPGLYGEENTNSHGVNLRRDFLEVSALKEALRLGVKVIGLCRGHQLINAVLGGKLYQDITKETGISHGTGHSRTNYGTWHSVHDFRPTVMDYWTNPTLAFMFPEVNSLHHQSVKIPGKGLDVILRARDGIVEATASKDMAVVSFQFHPEWMETGRNYFKKVMETGNIIW